MKWLLQVLSSILEVTKIFWSCSWSRDVEISFLIPWGAVTNLSAGIVHSIASQVFGNVLTGIICDHSLLLSHQGGYSTNLAPAKLVGKLFTSIDRSIHRMMGPTSPLPTMPQSCVNGKESNTLASSQSTMAMSSLVPSASVEGISECAGDDNRKNMHARSISEPDFGRKPKQVG